MDSSATQALGRAGDATAAAQQAPARSPILQPRALDAEYEWLGYESAHPTNWIDGDWPASGLLQIN